MGDLPAAFWGLLLVGIGVIALSLSFARYIVARRHPGTKLARFLSVAGRVTWVVVGVASWLSTQYSHKRRRIEADSWVVMSLAPITIEDLAPSPDKIPNLIDLVTDPEFQQLTPLQMYLIMIKVDPSLEGSSAYKLEMLADLMTGPPKSLGLSVTVKRHGGVYKALCSTSKLHYTDPDMPKKFANKEQPCGKLVSQYVGKTVPDWPVGGQRPALGIQVWVGMSTDAKKQGTLTFVANGQREEYSEEYIIWSRPKEKFTGD